MNRAREMSQDEQSELIGLLRIFCRQVFDNTSEMLYAHDLKGQYTYLNPAGERLTGYTLEEAIKLNLSDIVAPEHLNKVLRTISDELTTSGQTTQRLEITTKDGRRIPIETTSWLVRKDKRPIGVQGIARSILATPLHSPTRHELQPLSRLTSRQRQVLQLIAEGSNTKDIAYRLKISVKTVETHRTNLMNRLGIHDIAGLVRYAVRIGLVSA